MCPRTTAYGVLLLRNPKNLFFLNFVLQKQPLPEEFRDVTDAVITDIRQLEDLVELWNESTN